MVEHAELTQEDLDEILTWSLVRVTRFAAQRLAERLAPHDLNPVHFGVLAVLAVETEMAQADLARAVLLRPQSIAPLLDRLEARGLVRRSSNRARGRRNPIQITHRGRRTLDAVWEVALSTNDLSNAGLAGPESTELNRLLLKVLRATQGSGS